MKEQDLPIEGPAPVKRGKLNPLGQRQPEERIGQSMENLEHNQSASWVEEVRRKADEIQKQAKGRRPSSKAGGDYDPTGPDRQPGRVERQADLGRKPRQKQQGLYTQDNEEEGPNV